MPIPLHRYVAALHGRSALPFVITQRHAQRTEEAGVETFSERVDYRFEDGVVLRYELELDDLGTAQEGVCGECWIRYAVVDTPQGVSVTPASKVFSNLCQAGFWLRMMQEQE